MFCVRSVCVEDGSVGWADKGLREVERGSLFSSLSEHVVPESPCPCSDVPGEKGGNNPTV